MWFLGGFDDILSHIFGGGLGGGGLGGGLFGSSKYTLTCYSGKIKLIDVAVVCQGFIQSVNSLSTL